jgi:hypothetical protein
MLSTNGAGVVVAVVVVLVVDVVMVVVVVLLPSEVAPVVDASENGQT